MFRCFTIDILSTLSEEAVYIRKKQRLLKKLAKETHFNLKEVKALALIHHKICKNHGLISKPIFRDIFHAILDYTENVRHILINRIFSAMMQRNTYYLNVGDWVRGLSIILKGTFEEKIDFAFKVYDLTMMEEIKREHIYFNLRGCFINDDPDDDDPDEILREFVHLVLRTLDKERDGYVTNEKFKSVIMEKGELLLQCMGPVFPSLDAQYAFLTTFTNNIGKFKSEFTSLEDWIYNRFLHQ